MVFMLFTKRRLLGSNLNKFLQMAISSSKRDSRSLVEGSLNRLRPGNIFFLKMINYCLSFKTYVCAYILVYLRSTTLEPPTPLEWGRPSLKTKCQLYFIFNPGPYQFRAPTLHFTIFLWLPPENMRALL